MASESSPPHPAFQSPSGSRISSADSTHDRFKDPYAIGSPPRKPNSPQMAPKSYIHEYQRAFDHQRQAFDSERVMWNIERAGLLEKIAALETSLRLHDGSPSSRRPMSTNIPVPASGSPKSRSSSGPQGARYISQSTGNEFWRGTVAKGAAQPIRAFPESATYTQSNTDRLSTVTENTPPAKPGISLSESLRESTRGVSDPTIEKHYDGITFKTTSSSSAKPKENTPINSSTFAGSLSSTRESPGNLQMPTVHEEPFPVAKPSHDRVDNLIKDAGHTPLARYVPGLDGTTSALDSDLPTPASEQERPPLEPRASMAKVPSERADSYFPPPEDNSDHGKGVQEFDAMSFREHDPELQGLLGLKNERSPDNRFLNELDSKLAQVAESPTPPTAAQAPANRASREEVEGFDQPEPEPKLRIKRSMNFGSQLGGAFRPEP
ncbi:MAG: hypothetical protein LQ344_006288 [Seirophora lacunosa]|nr:MAG: hypothetical protein LQ344_006288 [Seirophora lacunosa]